MNIFALDYDPAKCAEYHCDRHVCKMIVETTQLLSTAHRVLDNYWEQKMNGKTLYHLSDPTLDSILYKATHVNHPCSVWARDRKTNYSWLYQLGEQLCFQYTIRYGKIHKCQNLIVNTLSQNPKNFPNTPSLHSGFVQCMPEEYKNSLSAVLAYKNYYNREKNKFAKWKYTKTPMWYEPMPSLLKGQKNASV